MKIRLSMLTEHEVQKICQEACLTEEQSRLFALLLRDNVTDVGAMQILRLGIVQYYAIKGDLILKILHVLFDNELRDSA